jgi:hypothetical protein
MTANYWAESPTYANSAWAERAHKAAQLITSPCSVLDVGAGAMDLRQFLPAGSRYHPADLRKTSEETTVVDLNRGEFPKGTYDVITMLGLLEYLDAPESALKAARLHAPKLVVSYSAFTFVTPWQKARRSKYHRKNFLRMGVVHRMLANAGWTVEASINLHRRPFRRSDIFRCVHTD